MNLALVASPRFAEHTPPPGHAERPERAEVMDAVASHWRERGAAVHEPVPASLDELTRVHELSYVSAIRDTAGTARMLDPDTFTSPESWEIACLAAGAAVQAGRLVLEGAATRAAALVRPPGHHATPDRAMGFCLINNVAVAAADALARGVDRVAVIDFDVHHGNGTQAMFERSSRVLYVSTHQWPLFPGTGAIEEVGEDDGAGFTVNIPLPPWCVDQDYASVFDAVVAPVLRLYRPDVVFVSAGFDAHECDPLARMRLTEHGFRAMTQTLVGAADECCGGRLVLVTEGGYDLPSLASSLNATLGVMAGADLPIAAGDRPAQDPETAAAVQGVIGRVRRVQSAFWRGL
jgi:acetoin utilization deacetylase AcuC-like enzyme